MNRAVFVASAIALAAASGGCSALVNPDTSRLHDGTDAGTPTGDVGPGVDAGPGDDAGHDAAMTGDDAGPGHDAGPIPDGGSDGGLDAAASCTAPPTCTGGVFSHCVGTTRVMDTCALGCAATEPRCAIFVPSNVPVTLFDAAAPDVTIDAMATLDTSVCTGLGTAHVVTQGDGSEVCLALVHDLRVNGGGVVRVIGGRPLIVLASGAVRIDGRVDTSAVRVLAGCGGGRGARPLMSASGAGAGADGVENGFADGGGGGGACTGHGGAGGAGYNGAGGVGGAALGASMLIPLVGGSGGGLGPGSEATGRVGNSGLGGAGGGALQISSQVSIRVDGAILAAGGAGGGGGNDNTTGGGNFGAGGGGGSGGGILLESPMLDIRGRLWTTGGGGGGSASTTAAGGAGVDGRDATTGPAVGGLSGGVRYGAAGGRSGAVAMPDGGDGETNTQTSANGGGGGGAVGRIVLRDASGTYAPDAAAVLSPSGIGLSILRVLTR